jgi:Protein of unknown function (DUF2786)
MICVMGKNDTVEVALLALGVARREHAAGVPASEWMGPLLAIPETLIDRGVDMMVDAVLGHLLAGGWTPIDLYELSRRRVDGLATAYLMDAVAAVTASHADHLVDPRWQAQLEQVDGRVWWDRRRPQFARWPAREGLSRHAALAMAFDLIAMVEVLPGLERVLPSPGTPPAPGSRRTIDPAQEKILAKVRALLAKAESTEFDDEAQALSGKAQELMSRYALDRAMVDYGRGVRQEATLCRIWLDNPYLNAKAMLVNAVASANRCRAVIDGRFGFVSVIGEEGDLRAVELLATSLLVQCTRAMLSTGSQVTRGGVSRTRSYRQSFLVSYASRIGERLRAANDASVSDADASNLLPVLASRSRAVEDLTEQYFPRLVAHRVSISNEAGWGAGRAAADRASLGVHEALGGRGDGRTREPRAG